MKGIITNRAYYYLEDKDNRPYIVDFLKEKYYIDEIEYDENDESQVRLISELQNMQTEKCYIGQLIYIDQYFKLWLRYGTKPIPKVKKKS